MTDYAQTFARLPPVKCLLVCGGRDYADWSKVDLVLTVCHFYHPTLRQLVHGAAKGADGLASRWARGRSSRITERPFRAQWKTYGRTAGTIRNQQMLDETTPDLVIAFPGGSGTADMIRKARARNITVIEILP